MRKLFLLLAAAALCVVACKKDGGNEGNDEGEAVEVNETTLAGTWEGGVEYDFAQGYPQQWRIKFEGKNYTNWHTTKIAGPTGDDQPGLKTVGNKEQGTWEYANGVLTLTPVHQWASYVQTSLSPAKNTYYNYDPVTMECDNWYVVPDSRIEAGVAMDIQEGSEWFISKWRSVSLTTKVLSVKINMDTFKLEKK